MTTMGLCNGACCTSEIKVKHHTVYVSGAMTGLPDHNFPAFHAAAGALRSMGHTVYNPAERGIIEGYSWEAYLRVDILDLMNCNAIFMLDGWQHSRGARLELSIAAELGMEVWTQ